MYESLSALHRANPRNQAGWNENADAVIAGARERVTARLEADRIPPRVPRDRRRGPLLAVVGAAAAIALVAAGVAAALSERHGSTAAKHHVVPVQALELAASRTARPADVSGVATVRIEHGNELWASSRIQWSGGDLSVVRDHPDLPRKGSDELRLVDGTVYGPDPATGEWLVLGSPSNFVPGSGTSPQQYLDAVREDASGATLRRLTGSMHDLIVTPSNDGLTTYRGTVAAGQVARDIGYKEGQWTRVLPFGYVAHDEANVPTAPLATTITVGGDDLIRTIAFGWGSGSTRWTFEVSYSGLGETAPPPVPENARTLRQLTRPGS